MNKTIIEKLRQAKPFMSLQIMIGVLLLLLYIKQGEVSGEFIFMYIFFAIICIYNIIPEVLRIFIKEVK